MPKQLIEQFINQCLLFNEQSLEIKLSLIKNCSSISFKNNFPLIKYHEALLFTIAYPQSDLLLKLANRELNRLCDFIQNSGSIERFNQSGVGGAKLEGAFSLTLVLQLLKNFGTDVSFHSFDDESPPTKEVFKFIFPEMEFELLSDEEFNNQKWLSIASGSSDKHQQLIFLVNNLIESDLPTLVKDHFFESLKIYISINDTGNFSRSYNRIKRKKFFYQSNTLIKKFDEAQVINSKLGKPSNLLPEEILELIKISQTALALLNRETDPITYCRTQDVLYYELDRGLSISLFSISPERRLPLESYIGFMMYKNGLPMSYGGAWIFGERALIGINIFETFRGGESAFVFAQLLRTYKQAFSINYFEVEPYQFGKNNPEGIKSGAFWFYYRFGFRPVNKVLNQLAAEEFVKIKSQNGYRTQVETLKKFTKSNVFVEFNSETLIINPSTISKYISVQTQSKFAGNRINSHLAAYKFVSQKLNLTSKFRTENKEGLEKLVDFFFYCIDWNEAQHNSLLLFEKMIRTKSHSEFEYIQLIHKVEWRTVLNIEVKKLLLID